MQSSAERDVRELAARIHFRVIRPDTEFSEFLPQFLSPLGPVFASILESVNTSLPFGPGERWRRQMPLFAVPRYSTLGIAALINCLVKRMPSDYAYLNIGVWNGFTLLAGIVGNPTRSIIGVDNFSEFGGPREDFLRRFERQRSSKHQFFDMDYRLFFSSHPNVKVGLYYYDGPHTYGDQYDALSLADPYLVDGAIVMVDDANWQEPRQATLDFVQRHEGKYALVLDLKTRNNGHPTYWNGLMILCKRTASR